MHATAEQSSTNKEGNKLAGKQEYAKRMALNLFRYKSWKRCKQAWCSSPSSATQRDTQSHNGKGTGDK